MSLENGDDTSSPRATKRARSSDNTATDQLEASGETDTQRKEDPAFKDEDADLILISADGWTFKVHKYLLQAHSSVFRDMLSSRACPTPDGIPQIVLTDPVIEAHEPLRIFLELLQHRRSISETLCTREKLVSTGFAPFCIWNHAVMAHTRDGTVDHTIRLAIKYDATFLLDAWALVVKDGLSLLLNTKAPPLEGAASETGQFGVKGAGPPDPVLIFELAARAGPDDLCETLIRASLVHRPRGPRQPLTLALHPATMSRDEARAMPFDYFWALQRAFKGELPTVRAPAETLAGIAKAFRSALDDSTGRLALRAGLGALKCCDGTVCSNISFRRSMYGIAWR